MRNLPSSIWPAPGSKLLWGFSKGVKSTRRARQVKGSHIVVPKFWDGPHAYLVQNTDKRVISINPCLSRS